MSREQKIVKSDRCLRRVRVPVRILRANRGRVQEARCGYGVATEAKDVEGGEVDSEPEGGFAEVVGYGLRVERGAPGVYGQS